MQRLYPPESIAEISVAELEALIRPSGYYRQKARRLKELIPLLFGESDSGTDGSHGRNFLLSLKGIGPETADSILLYAGNEASFIADLYTRRFHARLAGEQKIGEYERVKSIFEKALPKKGGPLRRVSRSYREARKGALQRPACLPRVSVQFILSQQSGSLTTVITRWSPGGKPVLLTLLLVVGFSLYSIDTEIPELSLLFRLPTGGRVSGRPMEDHDGMFLAAFGGPLSVPSIGPAGTDSFPPPIFRGCPQGFNALGVDGTVYISFHSSLAAINPSGGLLWRHHLSAPPRFRSGYQR